MKEKIKFVQEQLNSIGLNSGKADGIIGPKTIHALSKVVKLNSSWSAERKIIGFIQLLCEEKNIEAGPIDGLWGPQTSYAYEQIKQLIEKGKLPSSWREDRINPIIVQPNTNNWPNQNYDDLVSYYGTIGENQTKIQLPYTHKLSWDDTSK